MAPWQRAHVTVAEHQVLAGAQPSSQPLRRPSSRSRRAYSSASTPWTLRSRKDAHTKIVRFHVEKLDVERAQEGPF